MFTLPVRRSFSEGGSESRGLTLIEVLIVAFVLAVVAVAATGLGLLVTRSAIESERKNVAQSIAGEEMEIARTYSYAQIEYTDASRPGKIERTKDVERNGQLYTVDSLIAYVDDPLTKEIQDFKQLTVKVSWPRAREGVVLSSFFVEGQRKQPGDICIPNTITCSNPDGPPAPFLKCPASGRCGDIELPEDGDGDLGTSPTPPPGSGGGNGNDKTKQCQRDSDCSVGNFCQEGQCQPNWCKIISGAPLVDSGACEGQIIEECSSTCPSWRRLGELGVVSVCGRPSYCVITSFSFERCPDNPAICAKKRNP